MPIAKAHSEDTMSWNETVALYREELRFYLSFLIECDDSDVLLAKVEAEVKDRSVPDAFKYRFMVRVLVRHVIEHVQDRTQVMESAHIHSSVCAGSAGHFPAWERLVYFMRDILGYSKRETSLLIGTTDADVEKLLSLARKRIDMYEGPRSLTIENPNGTYFRWKFCYTDPREEM